MEEMLTVITLLLCLLTPPVAFRLLNVFIHLSVGPSFALQVHD